MSGISRITIACLLFVVSGVAVGCGAASQTGTTTPTPTSTPALTPAAVSATSCPSAGSIGSPLGMTLPAPTAVQTGSGLPSGATGIGCTYNGGANGVVEVVLAANVPTAYFSTEEQKLNGTAGGRLQFTQVSGVGDQAVTYSYAVGARTDAGVIARKGGNLAGVIVVGPTVALGQIESLVNTLLG